MHSPTGGSQLPRSPQLFYCKKPSYCLLNIPILPSLLLLLFTPLRSAVRLPPASPALLPVGAGGYFSSAEGRNIRAEVLVSKESRLATLLASRSYGKRSGGSFPPSSITLPQAPWCAVSYPRVHPSLDLCFSIQNLPFLPKYSVRLHLKSAYQFFTHQFCTYQFFIH